MVAIVQTAVPGRWWVWGLAVVLLSFWAFAGAQAHERFSASAYYQQCLRFEAGGDLETARQSCLNALQLEPGSSDTQLALARIELALGNVASAEGRLRALRPAELTAEAYLLWAEIAFATQRFDETERHLRAAGERLAERFNRDLEGRRRYLAGRLAERLGDPTEALMHYQAAVATDALELRYRLADARVRFQFGDAAGAREQLEDYRAFSGQDHPDLRSLLARIKWAQGDLLGAARNLEAAVAMRSARDSAQLADDLRALTLVYYGQGDFQSGGIALRSAVRRGNLLGDLLAQSLPWLLLLLLLLALHLVGESRVEATTGLELVEDPEPWTVGHVYLNLAAALLIASAAAIGYGAWAYGNYLALVTPLQSAEARALFLAVLSLALVTLALLRVKSNGWQPAQALLGSSSGTGLGLLSGLGLFALTVAVFVYAPDWPYLRGFYLDVSRLSPLIVAALVIVPLSELYFRAFAIPAFARRYHERLAVPMAAALFALVLGVPVVLLFAIGLVLGEVFRRTRSGLSPVLAQFVVHMGLVFSVAFSGYLRGLLLS